MAFDSHLGFISHFGSLEAMNSIACAVDKDKKA